MKNKFLLLACLCFSLVANAAPPHFAPSADDGPNVFENCFCMDQQQLVDDAVIIISSDPVGYVSSSLDVYAAFHPWIDVAITYTTPNIEDGRTTIVSFSNISEERTTTHSLLPYQLTATITHTCIVVSPLEERIIGPNVLWVHDLVPNPDLGALLHPPTLTV